MQEKKVCVKIAICPFCQGKGRQEIFNGDSYEKEECKLCKGKRVVKRIVTIEFEACKD